MQFSCFNDGCAAWQHIREICSPQRSPLAYAHLRNLCPVFCPCLVSVGTTAFIYKVDTNRSAITIVSVDILLRANSQPCHTRPSSFPSNQLLRQNLRMMRWQILLGPIQHTALLTALSSCRVIRSVAKNRCLNGAYSVPKKC